MLSGICLSSLRALLPGGDLNQGFAVAAWRPCPERSPAEPEAERKGRSGGEGRQAAAVRLVRRCCARGSYTGRLKVYYSGGKRNKRRVCSAPIATKDPSGESAVHDWSFGRGLDLTPKIGCKEETS